jgi:hypothetical protein
LTKPPDRQEPQLRAQAFGIPLTLHDDGHVAALSAPYGIPELATDVWHDPAGAERRWSGAQPTRTRELRIDNAVVLSVDRDDARGYFLRARGAGAALISPDGLEVICAPEDDGSYWTAILIGQVLPLVATVRGMEVFHASGVVRDGHAYMLCGAPGVGKTSIAAHLVLSGDELLSDDVVALDDRLVAHPGAAVLHVRAAELQQLGAGPTPGIRRTGTVIGRTTFEVAHPGHAQPLAAIYFLERGTSGPVVEPVPHPNPFELLGATFNLSVRTPARLLHHLNLCASLAERVPVFRVRITPGRRAAEAASALSAHIDGCRPARV